jgi:ribosomal 50S subunit-associated protein YjgA (DUF615 family)
MTINLARQSTKSLATLASWLIEISKKSEHAVVLNHPLLAALCRAPHIANNAGKKRIK